MLDVGIFAWLVIPGVQDPGNEPEEKVAHGLKNTSVLGAEPVC